MEYKTESEGRRAMREEQREQAKMSREERRREERIAEIRKEDPGFIPPVHVAHKRRRRVNFWLIVGVGVLIVLLLIWLSVAMFTGDTDVDMINLPGLL